VAYQSLAAVLGGVQTLATSSYDEALGVPSDEAAKLALRTQQVLGYETGVVRTADPLGGSYYVEHLTDRLEEAVNEYIAALDARGGILDAIASGELQHELADEAYRHQKDVEEGRRPKVGLNRFADDGQAVTVRAAKVDGARAEAEQIARLAAVRSARDGAAVTTALAAVRDSAVNDRNTIPSIIEAVRQYATLGEICEVLTDIWGRYRGSTRL
jgi:methylmalonyl-CoA mutase N-terminal domain/subunit